MELAVIAEKILKTAPWVVLGGICVKGLWDIGSRNNCKREKPVKPFEKIKRVTITDLKDYLPK